MVARSFVQRACFSKEELREESPIGSTAPSRVFRSRWYYGCKPLSTAKLRISSQNAFPKGRAHETANHGLDAPEELSEVEGHKLLTSQAGRFARGKSKIAFITLHVL